MEEGLRDGAGRGIRTPDQRFTKPLRYHYAMPASVGAVYHKRRRLATVFAFREDVGRRNASAQLKKPEEPKTLESRIFWGVDLL